MQDDVAAIYRSSNMLYPVVTHVPPVISAPILEASISIVNLSDALDEGTSSYIRRIKKLELPIPVADEMTKERRKLQPSTIPIPKKL